jgi:hypothetical protein
LQDSEQQRAAKLRAAFQNYEQRNILRTAGWQDDTGKQVEQNAWEEINEEFAELKEQGWMLLAIIEHPDRVWEWVFLRPMR